MKYLGFITIILLTISVVAQKQVSPVPVFEKEIRNGTSLKMRSVELERVKKEAQKNNSNNSNAKSLIKFSEIKKDFESIQKLQNSIVNVYTEGKNINYKKIAKYAESMNIKARRLDVNMFGEKMADRSENESNDYKDLRKKSVRDLIIKLDKTIGNFVTNPVFKDLKIVDIKASKNAQTELGQIILLSQKLFRKSEASR